MRTIAATTTETRSVPIVEAMRERAYQAAERAFHLPQAPDIGRATQHQIMLADMFARLANHFASWEAERDE